MEETNKCYFDAHVSTLGFALTMAVAIMIWMLIPEYATTAILLLFLAVVIGKISTQAFCGITIDYINNYVRSLTIVTIIIYVTLIIFACARTNEQLYDIEYRKQIISQLEVPEEQLLEVVKDKEYWDKVDSEYEIVLGCINALNNGGIPKFREYHGNNVVLRQIANLYELSLDEQFIELQMLMSEVSQIIIGEYSYYIETNILRLAADFLTPLIVIYTLITVMFEPILRSKESKGASIKEKAAYVNSESTDIDELKFQDIKEDINNQE